MRKAWVVLPLIALLAACSSGGGGHASGGPGGANPPSSGGGDGGGGDGGNGDGGNGGGGNDGGNGGGGSGPGYATPDDDIREDLSGASGKVNEFQSVSAGGQVTAEGQVGPRPYTPEAARTATLPKYSSLTIKENGDIEVMAESGRYVFERATATPDGNGRLRYGGSDYQAVVQSLEYVAFGMWTGTKNPARTEFHAFAGGYETQATAIPQTGSATYSGDVMGLAVDGSNRYTLSGDATLTADFSRRNISGGFSNMQATNTGNGDVSNWRDVNVNAGWAAGSNAFSGTTSIDGSSTAGGSITGKFYGTAAEEIGGAWNLTDGNMTAVGSFGAAKP
ncbi:transferrin-binding protein-like solute binding protein [Telmatospirillum sp. J64-1]|uniref:transferrin-binding protein-like solute binding protein n=1 Tax=Telmatospirillum sp. J64-1 TaxID=2502183 RepID=UPI00115DFC98|nr:transferrin-binding protein-like solute binding protein [Telmatospirillum sp. J64-1]